VIRSSVHQLFAPPRVAGRVSVALLLLRLFVGSAFWLHGSGKATDLAAFAADFHIPIALAAAAAYTQVIGALLLLAGVFTPVAALGVGSTMAVAVVQLIARGERFVNPGAHSWEASGFYLMASCVLILIGPGRWSIDAILWTRAKSPSGTLAHVV
jgi:putative oxidoreductase